LLDAKMMAQLTFDWIARAVGCENAGTPEFGEAERDILCFAMGEILSLAKKADDIFRDITAKTRRA